MTFEKNEQPQHMRDIAKEIVQMIADEQEDEITVSDYCIDEIAARLGKING